MLRSAGFLLALGLVAQAANAARSFNGSSQCGNTSTTVATGAKVTVVFWRQVASEPASGITLESSANYNSNNGSFIFDNADATHMEWGVQTGSGGYNTMQFTPGSAGAWHHYALTYDSALSGSAQTAAFVDGSAASGASHPNTTTDAALSSQTVNVAARSCASSPSNRIAVKLGELAIYNVILTGNEIKSLAAGTPPNRVRAESLLMYAPLHGSNSPEPDYSKTTRNVSLVGTPVLNNHPPVRKPAGAH